jgi:hypothetical protein
MKTMGVGFVIAALALAYAPQASAQTERPLFLDLNAAFQGAAKTLDTTSTFSLFGETGAAATRQQPGASLLADARLGYRVAARFAVALAVAGGRSDTTGQAAASVPSAIRFASPTLVTLDAPGIKRREVGYHIQGVWFLPFSGSTTVSLFGGPSVIRLQQGVPTVAVDAAQTPSVTIANETGTAKGVHVGADLSRAFSDRFGAGLFVRYVAASANLPSAAKVKVGGVQAGAGVRLRF